MIIGLCGQAGSGKDTVADMLVQDHGFTKVALADPLKRICRDAFAFTDEQLWGPSAMRNAPDKRYVREIHAYHELEDSAQKGPMVFDVHLWPRCKKCGHAINPQGDQPQCIVYLTPRHALQLAGTQFGRACYEGVWIDYALRVAHRVLYDSLYDAKKGLEAYCVGVPRPKGVVISDVRFKNEVDAIRAAKANVAGHKLQKVPDRTGIVWRIDRPGAGLEGAAGKHQSEEEQKGIDPSFYERVIFNHGSLNELRDLVTASLHDAQRA